MQYRRRCNECNGQRADRSKSHATSGASHASTGAMTDRPLECRNLGVMEMRGRLRNLTYLGTYLGVAPQSSGLITTPNISHGHKGKATLLDWYRRYHQTTNANRRPTAISSLQRTMFQESLPSGRSEGRGHAATRGVAMFSLRNLAACPRSHSGICTLQA
jgi:hypothetical protein